MRGNREYPLYIHDAMNLMWLQVILESREMNEWMKSFVFEAGSQVSGQERLFLWFKNQKSCSDKNKWRWKEERKNINENWVIILLSLEDRLGEENKWNEPQVDSRMIFVLSFHFVLRRGSHGSIRCCLTLIRVSGAVDGKDRFYLWKLEREKACTHTTFSPKAGNRTVQEESKTWGRVK